MNQIVLGTIREGKLCSIHREGFPVKYWANGGYDGRSDDGWYWFDPDGGMDEGFTPHPFDGEPFEYPMISVYDPQYRGVVLLVIVPDYITGVDEETVGVGPANPERLFNYVKEALRELAR